MIRMDGQAPDPCGCGDAAGGFSLCASFVPPGGCRTGSGVCGDALRRDVEGMYFAGSR